MLAESGAGGSICRVPDFVVAWQQQQPWTSRPPLIAAHTARACAAFGLQSVALPQGHIPELG